jgi:hypothetical protein
MYQGESIMPGFADRALRPMSLHMNFRPTSLPQQVSLNGFPPKITLRCTIP